MSNWPWQPRSVDLTLAAFARGWRRLVLALPTGMGKTHVAAMLIEHWLGEGKRVILYTNRRLLIDQLSGVMNRAGLPHGIRAAGFHRESHQPFQISSLLTEHSRVVRAERDTLHPADYVVVDEGHLHVNNLAARIAGMHLDQGARLLYLTATPIGMADVADDLIKPSTLAEGREYGALVMAKHFGIEEPDIRQVKKVQPGMDFSEPQLRKLMGSVNKDYRPDGKIQKLYGRILSHWKKLNPDGRPTILFAPGVKESVWLTQQFEAHGVRAAHIDGDDVYLDGEFVRNSPKVREEILEESKNGDIKVLCNRFVLREGIDAPWLAHGILATVFGSVQSYLQSGGRLLRASPGKEQAVIQDHGGSWWRHGSLNAERTWNLALSAAGMSGAREERIREKHEPEPYRCPNCGMIFVGTVCPIRFGGCGHVIPPNMRVRPVATEDGELVEQTGSLFPPRRRRIQKDTAMKWSTMWYRAYQGRMTFRQAEALFAHENYYYPEKTLPLMPRNPDDWFRRVRDVKDDELIGPVDPKVSGWRHKQEEKAAKATQASGLELRTGEPNEALFEEDF